jgi:DNA-binding MarR family transcriptional regulator
MKRRQRAADALDGPMSLSDDNNMQRLHTATVSACSPTDCAAEILEAVPAALRFIRAQMRRHRGSDLSVPQFRTLAFVHSHPGTSLSAVSEWLGLSLPATSRLVEGLVKKKLLSRRVPAGNRRVVSLSISARGDRTVAAARQATIAGLAAVVAPLSDDKRSAIRSALFALRHELEGAAAFGLCATERRAAGPAAGDPKAGTFNQARSGR